MFTSQLKEWLKLPRNYKYQVIHRVSWVNFGLRLESIDLNLTDLPPGGNVANPKHVWFSKLPPELATITFPLPYRTMNC